MSAISGLSALSSMTRSEGLQPLIGQPGASGVGGVGGASAPGKTNFQDVLFDALNSVNKVDSQAQATVAKQFVDPNSSQVDGYVRMMQADLAFRTLLQIRNKVLEAYNEIRQMQM